VQRIAFLALTLAMSAVAAVPKGNAENYPSRSIRLIVGFPPAQQPISPRGWSATS